MEAVSHDVINPNPYKMNINVENNSCLLDDVFMFPFFPSDLLEMYLQCYCDCVTCLTTEKHTT